jgi:hypothetical protein
MPKPDANEALLQKILKRLEELAPRVQKIPVEDTTGPRATLLFLDLSELSLITTDSDDPKFSLMFVSRDSKRFYANGGLVEYERHLADNRSWLRTSLKHLVNLSRIERSRVNRARDLKLEGMEAWVVNAVAPNSPGGRAFLDEFQARFITSV